VRRKSKREIEAALEEVDDPALVGWTEMLRYLQDVVAIEGAEAPTPAEYFGETAEWGPWTEALPSVDELDMPERVAAELTPVEIFGLRYGDADIAQGILELRGLGRRA
jgi:hypothetical protein